MNLTSADYVILMDSWWNPAVEAQASDRAHRIGQERLVTVYSLVAGNTIEEKIVALHRHKRNLAGTLLEGGDFSGRFSDHPFSATGLFMVATLGSNWLWRGKGLSTAKALGSYILSGMKIPGITAQIA